MRSHKSKVVRLTLFLAVSVYLWSPLAAAPREQRDSSQPAAIAAEVLLAVELGATITCHRFVADPIHQREEVEGTVIHADEDGLMLVNGTETSRNIPPQSILSKLPMIGDRFRKNTGVGSTKTPFKWLSRHEIQSLTVESPAPPDYVPPVIDLKSAVQAMIPMKLQPRAKGVQPLLASEFVAKTPCGARVEVRTATSKDGHRGDIVAGVVIHANESGLALLACRVMSFPQSNENRNKESVPSATHLDAYLPAKWIPAGKMTQVKVLIPPPVGYIASDLGIKDSDSR